MATRAGAPAARRPVGHGGPTVVRRWGRRQRQPLPLCAGGSGRASEGCPQKTAAPPPATRPPQTGNRAGAAPTAVAAAARVAATAAADGVATAVANDVTSRRLRKLPSCRPSPPLSSRRRAAVEPQTAGGRCGAPAGRLRRAGRPTAAPGAGHQTPAGRTGTRRRGRSRLGAARERGRRRGAADATPLLPVPAIWSAPASQESPQSRAGAGLPVTPTRPPAPVWPRRPTRRWQAGVMARWRTSTPLTRTSMPVERCDDGVSRR